MEKTSTIADYIDASCALHRLALTPEQRQRVIDTFTLNTALLSPLLDHALPAEIEAAPIFKA